MDNIQYIPATEKDIQAIIDFRIAFLLDYMGPQDEEDITDLRDSLKQYLNYAIPEKVYLCWLAKVDFNVVGIGGMSIRVQPGNFKNPAGITGYIMNMYTHPDHRKKGIEYAILKNLLAAGKDMGITAFELHATKDGAPVYEKAGFELHTEPTYRMYVEEGE